jgi:hypothetical protein
MVPGIILVISYYFEIWREEFIDNTVTISFLFPIQFFQSLILSSHDNFPSFVLIHI